MGMTIEQFGKQCHDFIAADPGPASRAKICALLQTALQDPAFVTTYVDPNGPERKLIYQDAAFGFCVLAHSYKGAKGSPPHDHGPTWAIYGQATGQTVMTDWEKVTPGDASTPGTVRKVKDYVLTPGMAYAYEPGALHSPRRDGSTTLIRIEGLDVSKITRQPYIAIAD